MAKSKVSQDKITPLLSLEEVAHFLGVSERTVHNYKDKRNLKYYKAGSKILFRMEEVLAWLGRDQEQDHK